MLDSMQHRIGLAHLYSYLNLQSHIHCSFDHSSVLHSFVHCTPRLARLHGTAERTSDTSCSALQNLGPAVVKMAEVEGLEAHKRAVTVRLMGKQ